MFSLVPAEDLLIANSIATVGGTLALLVGVFLGGKVADTIGEVSVLLIASRGRRYDRSRTRQD